MTGRRPRSGNRLAGDFTTGAALGAPRRTTGPRAPTEAAVEVTATRPGRKQDNLLVNGTAGDSKLHFGTI